MSTLSRLLVGLVILIHLGIAAGELFFWSSPMFAGLREGLSLERQREVDRMTPLVTNAGLYTAFIAVGLLWGMLRWERPARMMALFLGFVVVAGAFGALTLTWSLLVLQSLPAMIALGFLWADGLLTPAPEADADPAAESGVFAPNEPETVVDGLEPVGEEADLAEDDAGPKSGLYLIPGPSSDPSATPESTPHTAHADHPAGPAPGPGASSAATAGPVIVWADAPAPPPG
jgi:putative membrane protein